MTVHQGRAASPLAFCPTGARGKTYRVLRSRRIGKCLAYRHFRYRERARLRGFERPNRFSRSQTKRNRLHAISLRQVLRKGRWQNPLAPEDYEVLRDQPPPRPRKTGRSKLWTPAPRWKSKMDLVLEQHARNASVFF